MFFENQIVQDKKKSWANNTIETAYIAERIPK